MSPFDDSVEATVASALLLLAAKPVIFAQTGSNTQGGDNKSCDEEQSPSLASSDSKSCASSLSSNGSSPEIPDDGPSMDPPAAQRHLMKFRAVKRKRSRVCCSSINSTLMEVKPGAEFSISDESKETSGVSSESTAIPLTVQQRKKTVIIEGKRKKHGCNSIPICRKAEAILGLLSQSCCSEVKIRQILGDTPDTSKALRMLLKTDEIMRSGSGGRQDPYIYKIA